MFGKWKNAIFLIAKVSWYACVDWYKKGIFFSFVKQNTKKHTQKTKLFYYKSVSLLFMTWFELSYNWTLKKTN